MNREEAYFLGIDIGTFESKGVIIDGDCQIVAFQAVKHEMENPKPGFFEHDAEKVWWADFCTLSKSLIQDAKIDPSKIRCVGSSTLGADCLPVDHQCRPLRKAILYGIDSRAVDEMDFLNQYYSTEFINNTFGRPICSSDVSPKILWIKNNEPAVYQNTYKFLTATSYITAKLSGEYFIDKYLINTFAPLYKKDGQINKNEIDMFCRPDQLAECRSTTEIVGTITHRAAQETGLSEGTPVLTGTDDAGAEAISTGVFEPGDMMVMIGSTCYLIYCSDRPIKEDRLWHDDFIIPGTYSISGGTNTAGTLTRWYLDQLFQEAPFEEKSGGKNAYEIILDGLNDISPGSNGLITLPYFAGERTPLNDPMAKGIIFGLNLHHTKKEMYKSALEGVAYSISQHFEILKEHHLPINKVMVVGGGAKNEIWLQIIADVCGVAVHKSEINFGAAFGDALMAALGAGYFSSFSDFGELVKPKITFEPDAKKHKEYQKFFQLFNEIYQINRDILHKL